MKGGGKAMIRQDHESIKQIFVPATMDCEPVRSDIPEELVEVPVSVDYRRPIELGAAGETGYEWPYIASLDYDFYACARWSDKAERK
jgi:hypothetical protein